MSELTWETLLETQQQDFIQRLKASVDLAHVNAVQLSTLHYEEPTFVTEFACEQINLKLSEIQEDNIEEFCAEMVYKYHPSSEEDGYNPDIFMSWRIGKIGEEALKVYFGSAISPVDYEIYRDGDGGVDFRWKAQQHSISIQVKTRIIGRFTEKNSSCEINSQWDMDDLERFMLYEESDYFIERSTWEITSKEKQGNQVLVCVLLHNFAEFDRMNSGTYRCILAGFKPTSMIQPDEKLTINQLFYIGGLRAYLESLEEPV